MGKSGEGAIYMGESGRLVLAMRNETSPLIN